MQRKAAPRGCCSPWADSEFEGVMVESRSGGLTANGFLAKWAVMAAAAPRKTLAHLLYLGYEEDPGALFHIGRPRRQERKADQPARGVYQVRAVWSCLCPHVSRGCEGMPLRFLRQRSMRILVIVLSHNSCMQREQSACASSCSFRAACV